MSSFISLVTPEGGYLLTDAAAWDGEGSGILASTHRKVYTPPSERVAVTTMGRVMHGLNLADIICEMAEEIGVEGMFKQLQAIADDYRSCHGILDGHDMAIVLVTGFVSDVGGVHKVFQTSPSRCYKEDPALNIIVETPAYQVHDIGPFYYHLPTPLEAEDWQSVPRELGESAPEFLRRVGADLFEIVRRRPGKDLVTGVDFVGVGGWVDWTECTAAGVTTETLRIWPDRIGERIGAL